MNLSTELTLYKDQSKSNEPIAFSTILVASLLYSFGNKRKSNCKNPCGNYSKIVKLALFGFKILN